MYADPGLETPRDEQRPSGLYERGKLFFPKQDFQVDPGRLAFGQERLGITPLQMAMVASAIANDGVLMQPYLVSGSARPGGKVVVQHEAERGRTRDEALDRPGADDMMVSAVSAGTGTAAQISGVEVAGKTGTAETGVAGRNTTWFVAFAPAADPGSRSPSRSRTRPAPAASTAAPIAREIMTTALSRDGSP